MCQVSKKKSTYCSQTRLEKYTYIIVVWWKTCVSTFPGFNSVSYVNLVCASLLCCLCSMFVLWWICAAYTLICVFLWFVCMNVWVCLPLLILDWFSPQQPGSLVVCKPENKEFHCWPTLSIYIWSWPLTYHGRYVALCKHGCGSPALFSMAKLLSCKDGENTNRWKHLFKEK